MTIHALFKFAPNPYGGIKIDTTSNSGDFAGLSPFILKVPFEGRQVIFENLWQFSKVYKKHIHLDGLPRMDWHEWKDDGFANPRAVRYPMGKGAIPEYSFWKGNKLDYIDARKQIYIPEYARNVHRTESYHLLEQLYKRCCSNGKGLILLDYDAYDHIKLGMTLKDVINNPDRKMGHAFVLAMMLDEVLEECLK